VEEVMSWSKQERYKKHVRNGESEKWDFVFYRPTGGRTKVSDFPDPFPFAFFVSIK